MDPIRQVDELGIVLWRMVLYNKDKGRCRKNRDGGASMPPMLTWPMAGRYLAVSLPIVGLLWLVLSRRYRGRQAALGALAVVFYGLLVALFVAGYLDMQAHRQSFDDPWPGVIFTAALTGILYRALPVGCYVVACVAMLVLVIGLLEVHCADVDLETREKPDVSESAAPRQRSVDLGQQVCFVEKSSEGI